MATVLSRKEQAEVEAALPGWSNSTPEAAAAVRKLLDAMATRDAEFYSTSEAAAVFGVTQQTIRNWVDRRWLPGSRMEGGNRQIPREVVERAVRFLTPPERRAELTDQKLVALIEAPRRRSR